MKWLRLFLVLGVLVAVGCPSAPSGTPGGADDAATDTVDEAQEAEAAAIADEE